MMRYSIEYGFSYKEKLLDTGLDSLKTGSKRVAHKAGKFLGNKIEDIVTKSSDNNIEKKEPVKK